MKLREILNTTFMLILLKFSVFFILPFCTISSAIAAMDEDGCSKRSITVGQLERSYVLCVPDNPTEPMPILMAFHGAYSNADQMRAMKTLHKVGAQDGFITVYPNGCLWGQCEGGSWNSDGTGKLAGYSELNEIDDKGFLIAILDEIEAEYWVDPMRVYGTGASAGGIFAYSVACDLPDIFAAVSVTSAALIDASCEPSADITVLHTHGTKDTMISFAGQSIFGLPNAREGLEFWQTMNGCSTELQTTFNDGTTICRRAKNCGESGIVELCLVKDAGHVFFPPQSWGPLDDRFWSVIFGAHK